MDLTVQKIEMYDLQLVILVFETSLSYDAVIEWITLCHTNVTLLNFCRNIMTRSVTTMHFYIEIMFTLKKIKPHVVV